ncbi:MAG: translocation/assembly module TamB domain-containing protein, partial [Deltaproteobacteria bacterium]|nr:translocation/assembly module TamB domain-containing protein [Deltaproteobacteria bacterium]
RDVRLVWPTVELTLSRVTFKLDALALKDRHVRITHLEAENPHCRLLAPEPKAGPSGREPVEAAPEPPPEAKPEEEKEVSAGERAAWRVSIEDMSISQGSLEGLVEVSGQAWLGRLEELCGTGRLIWDRSWQVQVGLTGRIWLAGLRAGLALEAEMAEAAVDLSNLTLCFGPEERSRLTLSGRLAASPLGGDISLKSRFDPSDLPAALGLSNLAGPMELKGRMDGLWPEVDFTLQTDWAPAKGKAKGSLNLAEGELKAQVQVADLDPARLSGVLGRKMPAGSISFSGQVRGRPLVRLLAELDLGPIKLDSLFEAPSGRAELAFESDSVSGRISLRQGRGFGIVAEKVNLNGRLTQGGATAEVEFFKARGWQMKAERGRFNLEWQGERLKIEDLVLEDGPSRLTGFGEIGFCSRRPCSGRAELTLERFSPPTDFILEQAGLFIPLVNFSEVRLNGRIRGDWPGDSLEISSPGLDLTSPWGALRGEGRLRLTKDGFMEAWALNLNLGGFHVPVWLWPFLPEEVQGAFLKGRIRLEGGEELTRFEAELSGSAWQGKEIERLDARGSLAPDGISLEKLDLAFEGAEVNLRGTLWPQLRLETELQGQDLDRLLEGLTPLLDRPPPLIQAQTYCFSGLIQRSQDRWSVSGHLAGQEAAWAGAKARRLSLDLDMSDLDQFKGNLGGTIQGLTWQGMEPVDLWLDLTGREGETHLSLDLRGAGDQRVTLELDQKGDDLSGQGRITGLDLASWLALTGRQVVQSGRLDASFTLTGRKDKPIISFTGRAEGLAAAGQRIDALSLSARLAEGQLEAQGQIEVLGRPLGRLNASLPLRLSFQPWVFEPRLEEMTAQLTVEDLPLAALQTLVPALAGLSGRLSAQLELTPRPAGWIEVSDLNLSLPRIEEPITDGRVRLRLEGRRFVVEEGGGRIGGGEIAIEGWVGLEEDPALDLALSLSQTDLGFSPYGRVALSARLRVSQSLSAPEIEGRVKVHHLSLNLPPSGAEESGEVILVDEIAPDRRSAPRMWDRLGFKVAIELEKGTEVEGQGVKITASGVVTATRVGEGLALTGRLEADQGVYIYLGRRFLLDKAALVFHGLQPPQPSLEVEASHRVKDVVINLFVTGPLTSPRLSLSSQPPLIQEEVQSYLVFGRPSSRLNPNQAARLESMALGALGGRTFALVREALDERIAPDTIVITTTADGGLAVETGKEILPDLYVSYEVFSQPDKPNEVHIEYYLTPNVSVRSSIGDERTSGVDMYFRYDF